MVKQGFGARPLVLRCARCGKFVDWEHARFQVVCGCRGQLELPPVLVRPMEERDRPRVQELFITDFGHMTIVAFGEAMHADRGPALVAEMRDDIAGALAYRTLDNGLHIVALATDPMWQRSGVAGYLVAEADDEIRTAARLYATGKPAMCFHGLGMTEHLQGTEVVMALVNLALLTGNIGKPGSGINPLRGQNNVQGAAVMGCDPGALTGSAPLHEARARFESLWQAPIPSARGLNLLEMMDAARAGRLKALYVVGYDILLSLASTANVRRALGQVETVIVQDFAMNRTAREFGTVFLPVATAFEKDGTFSVPPRSP